MAKSKNTRNKKYNPRKNRDLSLPWWKDSAEKAKIAHTNIGLDAVFAMKRLKGKEPRPADFSTLGSIVRLARHLACKMENEHELVRTLALAEGATTALWDAHERGEALSEKHIALVDEGVTVSLDVVEKCGLYETHKALLRAMKERTTFKLVEDEDERQTGQSVG